MNTKALDLLKQRDYIVPRFLIEKYKTLGISSDNVILLIYLINQNTPIICDYQKISSDLNIDLMDVMTRITELKTKKIIEVELKKNALSKLEEYINLDLLYDKVFLNFIDEKENKEEDNSNVFSKFESELGRPLSPTEYEHINAWLEQYNKDIIIEALKEAVISGVVTIRYIDRILFDWDKKGINTLEKLEKNQKKHKENKSTNIEVPDYDWLNSNE